MSSSQPFSPQNEIPLVRNATQSYAGSPRCGGMEQALSQPLAGALDHCLSQEMRV